MHELSDQNVIFITLTVMMFMFLGIIMMIIIDHKVKIPGHFQYDPFSVSGLRLDQLVTSFVILSVLLIIITRLSFALVITLIEHFNLFAEKEKLTILLEFEQQRATERKRQFHHVPAIDRVNLGKKPVCFYCHSDYPHSKLPKIRVLLNMHTQFIGCLTCHNDPRKLNQESLRFAWLNYSGIEVTGPHFCTDVDPESGFLIKTDDYYSKIVAYSEEGGENKLLEIPETNPEVQVFLAIRNQLTVSDRQSIKRKIHKNVMRKGRTCIRCHTSEDKSYLPFRQLGFSQQRISVITSQKIIGIVEKYRKTMIPNFFR